MMKRIKNIILCLLLIIVSVFSLSFVPNDKVSAESEAESTESIKMQIQTELLKFIEIETPNIEKQRYGRIPGSAAEYNAAIYLRDELLTLKNFKPVNNSSTSNGIESFEFESVYDGNMYTSQNVIFKRESIIETNRKIILTAHYDTAYIYQEDVLYSDFASVSGDGINNNAASVATLLAFVKNLDKMILDYGFDVEVVFFGASTNDYDGSKYYVKGQADEDAENTLLVINLDKIALGDYNYAYVNEFNTNQEEYIFENLYGFKKLKNGNTLDFNLNSPNGLDYTHVGLESDHALFMKRNVNVVSFFSGNYESVMTYGLNEYEDKENITYTENDSYLYINYNYANFYTNLANVYNAINTLISDDNFISVMERDNGLAAKYKFWTNEKLSVFITSILLVVFIFIYLLIYKNLQDKSKIAMKNSNVDDVVIKITANISDGDNEDLNDAIDKKIKHDTDGEDN